MSLNKHNVHHFPHSTSIPKIDYDDDKNEMHITFATGGTHAFDCKKEVYEALKAAESPGKHFHQHVRKGYNSRKVD